MWKSYCSTMHSCWKGKNTCLHIVHETFGLSVSGETGNKIYLVGSKPINTESKNISEEKLIFDPCFSFLTRTRLCPCACVHLKKWGVVSRNSHIHNRLFLFDTLQLPMPILLERERNRDRKSVTKSTDNFAPNKRQCKLNLVTDAITKR